MALTLDGFGGVALAERRPVAAARLFGAAEKQANGEKLGPVDQPELDRDVAAARAQMDAVDFERAWAEGQAMTLEQAVAYSLSDVEP